MWDKEESNICIREIKNTNPDLPSLYKSHEVVLFLVTINHRILGSIHGGGSIGGDWSVGEISISVEGVKLSWNPNHTRRDIWTKGFFEPFPTHD